MLNFIIYEDQKRMRDLYEKIVHRFIGSKQDTYNIVPISEFDDTAKNQIDALEGRKIYILDIEVPGKSGFDFAREIRKSGDWKSQIIIVSAFEHFRYDIFMSKILTLDFISKNEDVSTRLKESLELAYDISTSYRTFSFKSNGAVFHIPYHDILYFEKDLNDNYTSIVTKQSTYKIKKSIMQIEKIVMTDWRFFKTHQSCIINIQNVKYVNLADQIICFGEKQTNLLTRERKKELQEKLINS